MKQAILVTAYKDVERLRELIGIFGDGSFEFYIHVDRKSGISRAECADLARIPHVACVSRKYRVNWGGRNHLKAILLLATQAAGNKEVGYVHLISGSDYPIKGLTYFKEFAMDNRSEYLENFPIPTARWYKGGMNRVEYYYPMDLFDTRHARLGKYYDWILRIQERWGMKRAYSSTLPALHGGSTWWSLTRDCVEYVVKHTSAHPRLLQRLKHTFIPEEFYFQTVVMNSPFARNVVNDNLRHIDWNLRNGNCPAVLDISDSQILQKSGALFARKVEMPISSELIEYLRQKGGAVI